MIVLVLLASAAAGLDWFGVWRGSERLEAAAKALVPALLLAAIVADAPGTSSGLLVAIALAFALAGDVLLLPFLDRFVVGLAAFLAAHLLLVAAFLVADSETATSILSAESSGPGAVKIALMGASVVAAAGLGYKIVGAVLGDPSQPAVLTAAVGAYITVLTAMVLAGLSTGEWLAATGALVFAASDAVLGWNRFVRAIKHGRLKTHILYHPALILISLWAVT